MHAPLSGLNRNESVVIGDVSDRVVLFSQQCREGRAATLHIWRYAHTVGLLKVMGYTAPVSVIWLRIVLNQGRALRRSRRIELFFPDVLFPRKCRRMENCKECKCKSE